MMAAANYQVLSYHLNIDEGDCSVHLLYNIGEEETESAVLVDGGFGANGSKLIPQFMVSPEFQQSKCTTFQAVVVTHWDSDHAAGVLKLFSNDFKTAVNEYVKKNKKQNIAQIKNALDNGEVQGSLLTFEEDSKTSVSYPTTRMYAPYWNPDKSMTGRDAADGKKGGKDESKDSDTPTKGPPPDLVQVIWDKKRKTNYVYFNLSIKVGGKAETVWIRGLELAALGGDMIGLDIFSGARVMDAGDAKSPEAVSKYMADGMHSAWTDKPAMFCIGSDSLGCDPAGLKSRTEMEWADEDGDTDLATMDLSTMKLTKVVGKKAAAHDISAQSIKGHTTADNQASVACMIFWPNATAADVSHYFAGDVGDEIEERLLRWATVPTTAKGDVRETIQVQAMKLSHHGSKLSTPATMLFAFLPVIIVASNGMRTTFNHVSWETLVLIWAWTIWKASVLELTPEDAVVLATTNFPVYLCKRYVQSIGKKKGGKEYVSPGSIQSLRSTKSPFNALLLNLMNFFDKTKFSVLPDLSKVKGDDDDERAHNLTQLIVDGWQEFSYCLETDYVVDLTNVNEDGVVESAKQEVRAVLISQTTANTGMVVFRGTIMSEIENNSDDDDDVDIDVSNRMKEGGRHIPWSRSKPTSRPTRIRPQFKPLGGQETVGDRLHSNRRRNARGRILGNQTFLNLIKDRSADNEMQSSSLSARPCARSLARFRATGPRTSVAGPYFVVASDAEIRTPPPGGVHRVEEGHLDWFIGDTITGALVLASEPPAESTKPLRATALDGNDETYQWLMACLGSASDGQCALSTTASVGSNGLVKIDGFELRTKLKFVWGDSSKSPAVDFFQTPIVFSAANNAHTFDLSSATWPNISASGNVDVVSPAHVMCVSLGPTPSIAGAKISGLDILRMMDLEPKGLLAWIGGLEDFQLDTGKGKRNALWFTPGDQHKTTIRLGFKQATTNKQSLLDTIHNFILDVTGISKQHLQVMDSSIIVKKTWTLVMGMSTKVRRQVTAHTQVKMKGDEIELALETALTFGNGKVQWVLNFGKTGHTFSTLVKFIADVFSTEPLPENMDDYLPGADKIAIRRVVYTQHKRRKTLEVLLQVSFAGMTLLCSLSASFGNGKAKFGLFGGLFQENRPAKMGQDFLWIPYMDNYEPWTALHVGPVENAVGVLEEVDGTDVGHLGDTFNALSKTSGASLDKSPTSLDLVGLKFALTGDEVSFSALVMSDPPPAGSSKVPPIKLLGAKLDLRYDLMSKTVSNCSLDTVLVMACSDLSVQSAMWNLRLEYENPTWTLSGGVTGLRGSLLYTLFDTDCNLEMMQLLDKIVLDLQLTYKYTPQGLGSEFEATGTLHLGHLELDATYIYPSNGNWSLDATLRIRDSDGEQKSGNLRGVIQSICGEDVASVLPESVGDIVIQPVGDKDMTSFKVIQLDMALLVLVKLQITATTSVAFYQYQAKRKPGATNPPPVKRALVFSAGALPNVDGIPLVGSLPQPFDEVRFMWVGGDERGWTRNEVQTLNQEASKVSKGYPLIPIKAPGQVASNSMIAAEVGDAIVLKSSMHLCLIHGGETRLDYAFGQKKSPAMAAADGEITAAGTTSPVNKTIGPVKILGVGIDFDVPNKTLKLILDGTVQLGPIELTLLGFSVSFNLDGVTLRDFKGLKTPPTFTLDGLGVAFQKDPISIAGLFEHQLTEDADLFLGGAVVGFKQWRMDAGGYYGTAKQTSTVMGEDEFKAFLAYVRVAGPVATIGYAEIRGLVGGFGYNTSVKFPNMQNVMDFPFLAKPKDSASQALTAMLDGGWFSNKKGQNWVAAGFTVIAFEMLTVSAVIVVEWGSGVKLGVFGLATAEMPRQLSAKFAVVQLGIVATIDVDAGIMKVDGQLTPASYVLDPSCHLTGGFALYSWFGNGGGTQQGDWVFTIGGYHAAYAKPLAYPSPPRLAISWSYNKCINITGKAYFAVTPKVCMGGGSLRVTLSLGPLYAHLDAYADFLINYRPFMYQASGGVVVGVRFTLDLWLVSITISVSVGAIVTLRGPPLAGTVHVNFYVFGFDIDFGEQQVRANKAIELAEFYRLVLQTAPKASGPALITTAGADKDLEEEEEQAPPPHILNCISGLIPQNPRTDPGPAAADKWVVRGAVFAFTVSCKFAVAEAKVYTLSNDPDEEPYETSVESRARAQIYAKPMQRTVPLGQSLLEVSIEPPHRITMNETEPTQFSNPEWTRVEVGYSNLPTGLWGKYDKSTDPAEGSGNMSNLLDGQSNATAELMTSLTLYSPTGERQVKDHIAAFDVAKAMGEIAGETAFPVPSEHRAEWLPQKPNAEPNEQYKDVKGKWKTGGDKVGKAAEFMAGLGLGGWDWPAARERRVRVPERLIGEMEKWYTEAPVVCSAV